MTVKMQKKKVCIDVLYESNMSRYQKWYLQESCSGENKCRKNCSSGTYIPEMAAATAFDTCLVVLRQENENEVKNPGATV